MSYADSAEHVKSHLKCFCGKDMQYDKETGVWNCDDSVYVPSTAHLKKETMLEMVAQRLEDSWLAAATIGFAGGAVAVYAFMLGFR